MLARNRLGSNSPHCPCTDRCPGWHYSLQISPTNEGFVFTTRVLVFPETHFPPSHDFPTYHPLPTSFLLLFSWCLKMYLPWRAKGHGSGSFGWAAIPENLWLMKWPCQLQLSANAVSLFSLYPSPTVWLGWSRAESNSCACSKRSESWESPHWGRLLDRRLNVSYHRSLDYIKK